MGNGNKAESPKTGFELKAQYSGNSKKLPIHNVT